MSPEEVRKRFNYIAWPKGLGTNETTQRRIPKVIKRLMLLE